MRIGIDTRELVGKPTGVGRYLAELLARWTRDASARGHELLLFSPVPPAGGRPWLGEGGATWRELVVPGSSGTFWEQFSLARALHREHPDVFFAPGYTAPLTGRIPLVLSIHDVSFAAHPEWFPWRQGLRRRWLTRQAANRAARVLTLSAFSREEIVQRLGTDGQRVTVTPLAADSHPSLSQGQAAAATERQILPAPGARMALYVGTVINRRQVPLLIRAFGHVTRQLPDAVLEIVGENRTHPHEDLQTIVRDAGITRCVHVRDYVDDRTLADLYAQARVFVFLSMYEGFGLTPLEAMRKGVPTIVADTEVAREVYGEAPLFVPIGDEQALAGALSRLLTDDEERRRRAVAGLAVSARYSWDATARQVLDALVAAGAAGRS